MSTANLSPKAIKALTAMRDEKATFWLTTKRTGTRVAECAMHHSNARAHGHLQCREDGWIKVRGVDIAEFDELIAAGLIANDRGNAALGANGYAPVNDISWEMVQAACGR